jgi:hypothetical protein
METIEAENCNYCRLIGNHFTLFAGPEPRIFNYITTLKDMSRLFAGFMVSKRFSRGYISDFIAKERCQPIIYNYFVQAAFCHTIHHRDTC